MLDQYPKQSSSYIHFPFDHLAHSYNQPPFGNLPVQEEISVNHPVKTLAALALVGFLAPSAMAMSIKDDVVSLKLKGNVQFRASLLNDAQTSTGADYDPIRGTTGQSAEDVRFDMRRVRLGFEAKMGDWFGNITIRSEKNDQAVNGGASTANGGNGRPVQLYYAKIGRDFKSGDMIHQIRMGLDKSFNNESSFSSSTFLFPSDTIVAERIEERGVGLGYMFSLPFLNFGVDLHNNSTGTKDVDSNSAAFGEKNGYFYSARLEFAPGADFMPAKKLESFTGKEGTHLVLGADAQWDTGSLTGAGLATPPAAAGPYNKVDVFTWGPDLLFHWNAVTFKAEYRVRQTGVDTTDNVGVTTSAPDASGKFWDAQVAYAFPTEMVVIEPAVGYMINDTNVSAAGASLPSNASYGGGADNGADGQTTTIGLNFYWNGHDNKTQIAYQMWKAEQGDADATIVRLQHQINF
jgi:hypothetical protein